MKKLVIFIWFLLIAIPQLAGADVIDAPHTASQGVLCGNCHTYSLWWEFSPSDTDPARTASIIEPLCASCHDGASGSPHAETHSSLALKSMHNEDYGDWSRTCLDCHDPHFQEQLQWQDVVPDSDLFLVQGTITSTPVAVNNGEITSSTFNFEVSFAKDSWLDPASWSNKNKEGRGLILLSSPDEMTNSTFEVMAASEDVPGSGSGSMTVKGDLDDSFNDKNFGLIYGQYIKKTILVDPDNDTVYTPIDVKFFDGKGGFVSANLDGICQVCHRQTGYFTYNTWPEDHLNILLPENANTLSCTQCHDHSIAFGHGSDGGSFCANCHNNDFKNAGLFSRHVEHLELELACSRCHNTNSMRDEQGKVVLKDGADVLTTTVCDDCHQDGTEISTGLWRSTDNTYRNLWGAGGSSSFTCDGCHNTPPDYDNGAPKANTHTAHAADGWTCDKCHYATTTDGTTLIGTGSEPGSGSHTNANFDVVPGPTVAFNYTYADTGGSCATISCHNNGSGTWGQNLLCSDCHLDSGADVDDFTFNNQIMATINTTEWLSSGHGRPNNESYPVSANPGAGLSCEYCHDRTVSHNNEANPFRLIASSISEGFNGVCWACHQTGASGYDPPGDLPPITSSTATKVDSYHEFLPGAGGQFCWDCHDPHGDSNILMIHDKVATSSDSATGEPRVFSTQTVDFKARDAVDFADAPTAQNPTPTYNKICNVCHIATLTFRPFHYTVDAGDNHGYDDPQGRVCTDCHDHTGRDELGNVAEKMAFSQGNCLDCHDTEQVGVHATRRAIGPEFPQANVHAHYGNELDNADCRVCHDTTDHMSGNIVLIDADWDVLYRGTDVDSLIAINTYEFQFDDVSDFCMSCHDEDGATRLPNPMDPFANQNAPPDVATRFKGTLVIPESFGYAALGGMNLPSGTGRNVLSHHPLSRSDQGVTGSKLECTGCHGVHSAAASQKLADPDNPVTVWTGTGNEFCLACHDGGTGPTAPGFPAGVSGPVKNYYWYDVPGESPGDPCDTDGDPGTVEVYDCKHDCYLQSNIDADLANNTCEDGEYIPPPSLPMADLRCDAFGNDGGDCASPTLNTGYSLLTGLDTCDSYFEQPWKNDIKWSVAAHGGGTKRTLPGYVQTPQLPSYQLDCITCHDPHGSYSPSRTAAGDSNPYMIRDFVDGTQFVDDGSIYWPSNKLGCAAVDPGDPSVCLEWEQMGTSGNVEIKFPAHEGDDQPGGFYGWTGFCSKCHVNWKNATSGGHNINGTYKSCLSCHSHGGFGDRDIYSYRYGMPENILRCDPKAPPPP